MAPGRLILVLLCAVLAFPLGDAWCGGRGLWRPHPYRGFRPVRPPPGALFLPPSGATIYFNQGYSEPFGPPPLSEGLISPLLPPAAPQEGPAGPLPSGPPPSMSQGMVITVRKILDQHRDDGGSKPPPVIDRPKQAVEQLAACWSPPLPQRGETVEVTLRFAFDGQGGVMGAPRITYVKAGEGLAAADVRESILAAVKQCTPLHFSASMAASAPGYPLAVRFIGERGEDDPQGKR
ncbi:hypothetical protein [Rhodoblastus sp.]|uniref:hypothetical protein n=1 Tax=Rhodoblastus sp. TaxID=1962975 RepID=UPI0035B07EED